MIYETHKLKSEFSVPPSILATMPKQHCRTLQVKRLFRQCRMLLRQCCLLLRHCCWCGRGLTLICRSGFYACLQCERTQVRISLKQQHSFCRRILQLQHAHQLILANCMLALQLRWLPSWHNNKQGRVTISVTFSRSEQVATLQLVVFQFPSSF